MVKKRVPDWLNSPMWPSPMLTTSPPPKSRSQSPPPPSSSNGDRLAAYLSKLSCNSSLNKPHVMLQPPSSTGHVPTPKTEIRDSSARSSDSDNDITSSVDDFTHQLLFAYLPSDKGLWSSELAKKRSQYKHFKEDLLMNPSEIMRKLEDSAYPKNGDQISECKGLLARSKIPHGEHPLSLGKTSIWNRLFQVNAEADTFFCYIELLSGFQDDFCQQLDNSIVGIRSTISKLSVALEKT